MSSVGLMDVFTSQQMGNSVIKSTAARMIPFKRKKPLFFHFARFFLFPDMKVKKSRSEVLLLTDCCPYLCNRKRDPVPRLLF